VLDVVSRLGAVQSQDYKAAVWALGLRTRGLTEADIDRLFDMGAILRTHVMRPTWHFVLPESLRGLLTLTGPRLRAGSAGRHRELGLDPPTIERAEDVFASELAGGRHRTRSELGEALGLAGISPEGQRLAHLLMCAELDQVIVSGPRQGKRLTYALFDERVPPGRDRGREEIAADLAAAYFRGHGPAQLVDFVWWSGLTTGQCRSAIALAGDRLASEAVGGTQYWFDAAEEPTPGTGLVAHLLPNFDEYTVAYRDRTHAQPDFDYEPEYFPFSSILSNVVLVNGRVRGAWRRVPARGALRVEVRLLAPLAPEESAAVEASAARMAEFTGRPVELAWVR